MQAAEDLLIRDRHGLSATGARGDHTLRGELGEPHRERRAAARAGALGADRAAVTLHEVAHDGEAEPEPEPAVGARAAAVALVEALEN
jgi:hypothetical protein